MLLIMFLKELYATSTCLRVIPQHIKFTTTVYTFNFSVMTSEAPAPAEAPGPAETPAPASSSHAIKEIKREQKKDGAEQFLVVYEDADTDKGQWVPASDVPADLITAFREKKKRPAKPAADGAQPRKIKEIKGICPDGNDLIFVVRFRDSPKCEGIRRAEMHKQYPQALLKYYEQNMERIPVKRDTAGETV